MSKAIDDLVALMPNARPERVANNVFDITVPIAEADAFNAAIDTLRVFGADAIAFYVYEFGDIRVRITFRSGYAEPLIFYASKLRSAS